MNVLKLREPRALSPLSLLIAVLFFSLFTQAQTCTLTVNDVFTARPVSAKHKHFPIPQDEINANHSIEQNTDWK